MKSSRRDTPTPNSTSSRRSFLKQSALAGSSLLFLSAGSRGLGAEPARSEGTDATAPTNDTLKTIRSLRTIHGNFLDQPLPEPALQAILRARSAPPAPQTTKATRSSW